MVRNDATGPGKDTGHIKGLPDQVSRLAHRLRDEGVVPERDLWPEIDQSISASEQHQIRPLGRPRRDWLRSVTAAAAVMALVAFGWWGQRQGPEYAGLPDGAVETAGGTGASSDLDVIDQALDELNLALTDDPDNRSLTNLSLMLHKSRGRILRQYADPRFRGG